MKLHFLDTLVMVAYMAIVLAMGFYFARKNNSTEEYFVGGRRFRGWVVGLSLVGTSISSITFLAYPADAYKTAWLRYLPNLALPVGVAIAAWYFLPFFRRTQTTTAYEFLEQRFAPSVRVYGAIAYLVAQLVRVSMILWLLSLLIQEVTGLSPEAAIVLGGLFVGVYTILGGIDAVIWTDVLQTIVLLAGGLFCIWIIIDLLPGGLDQIISHATEAGKFGFATLTDNNELEPVGWHFSLSEKTGTMMLFVGLTAWLTEYSSNQNTVQRYCASASTREARKGMLVCVLSSLPIWAFYMFLGTALWVFFQQFPSEAALAMLDGSDKAENILPWFISEYLPPGVAGLVIAAALAAAMSSLDSSLNSITTVATVDIYKRHIRVNQTDRHYLRFAWATAAIVTLWMIAGALILHHAETRTLQDTSTILVSILGGGLLGLYLLGFFTRKGRGRAAWCGIGCTMLFTGWTIAVQQDWLPEQFNVPFDLYYTGLVGNLVMFIIGYTLAVLLSEESDFQRPARQK